MQHLGGHNNVTNLDIPIFEFLIKQYKISSIIDIGCGPAGLKKISENYNIRWFGIDGDPTVITNSDNTLCHDFTQGIPIIDQKFDLAWSVEFLEHVEEKYIKNFMPVFQKARHVLITAALPNTPGHHHVNCQPNEYWVEIFKNYGFSYRDKETSHLRSISAMRKNFFKKAGLFFTNDIFK